MEKGVFADRLAAAIKKQGKRQVDLIRMAAERDLLRKRKGSGVNTLLVFNKKSEQAIHSLLRRGAAEQT